MSTSSLAAPVQLDVWSDYVCPFCYLELPVLDELVGEFGTDLAITWRAFELRPEPVPTLEPTGDYLTATWARAVYPMAAERGMSLRLPPVQPRSRRALTMAEYARELGPEPFDRVHRALFRAFFEEGRDIGRTDVLLDVGAGAGLDPTALAAALDTPHHEQRVIADERLAAQLGLEGVPALVLRPAGATSFRDARLVSGAQPTAALRRAIEQVALGAATERETSLRRRLPLASG